jgi:hypothetical protein
LQNAESTGADGRTELGNEFNTPYNAHLNRKIKYTFPEGSSVILFALKTGDRPRALTQLLVNLGSPAPVSPLAAHCRHCSVSSWSG